MRALILLLACSSPAVAQEIKSDDLVTLLEGAFERALERTAPCVVALRVDREPEAAPKAPSAPRLPFGGRPMMPEDVFAKRPKDAWCTGVIVEPTGTILTTHFNVSGTVKSIRVMLHDGREFPAKLLGYNGTFDLAAIKIEAEGLPVLKKAALDDIKAGQTVVAVGRAPDGRGLTVNPGIISAASRLGGKGLQTDAKLNFGNVGGPLVDLEGRLVAVTCKVDTKAGISSTRGQNSGVGFAITHDRFNDVLADLKAGRNVAENRRPVLGVRAKEGSTKEGAELLSVDAGSAAERAGIKSGDVIVEFEGTKIATFDELRFAVLKKAPGDKVKVKVLRGEESHEFDLVLGWADGE